MVDPLTTFLGSIGGGVVTGGIKIFIAFMVQRQREKREHEREMQAQWAGNAEAIMKARMEIAEMKPVKYVTTKTWTSRRILWFFGDAVPCSKTTTKYKLSQLPSEKTINSLVVIFGLFYCCCVGAYIYQMTTQFPATNPNSGGGFSVLGMFNFHWGKNKMIEYSGGGAGLYLLSPMIMWITHVVTGKIISGTGR